MTKMVQSTDSNVLEDLIASHEAAKTGSLQADEAPLSNSFGVGTELLAILSGGNKLQHLGQTLAVGGEGAYANVGNYRDALMNIRREASRVVMACDRLMEGSKK